MEDDSDDSFESPKALVQEAYPAIEDLRVMREEATCCARWGTFPAQTNIEPLSRSYLFSPALWFTNSTTTVQGRLGLVS